MSESFVGSALELAASSASNGDIFLKRRAGASLSGITRVDPQGAEVWSYDYAPKVKRVRNVVEMSNGDVVSAVIFTDTTQANADVFGVLRCSSNGSVIRARAIYPGPIDYWYGNTVRELVKHEQNGSYHLIYDTGSADNATIICYFSAADVLLSSVRIPGLRRAYAIEHNGSLYVAGLGNLLKLTYSGSVVWSKGYTAAPTVYFYHMAYANNEIYIEYQNDGGSVRRPGIAVFDTLGVLQRNVVLDMTGTGGDYEAAMTMLDEGPLLTFQRGTNLQAYAYAVKFNTALTFRSVITSHRSQGTYCYKACRTTNDGVVLLTDLATYGRGLILRMPSYPYVSWGIQPPPCWSDTTISLFSAPLPVLPAKSFTIQTGAYVAAPVTVTSTVASAGLAIDCSDALVHFTVRVRLEGPMETGTGLMRTDLRASGLIPLTEPYTALGYPQFAGGGGETTTSAVLNASGTNAVVDWVRLELRSSGSPGTIIATRQALVQRDGDVVAADGSSSISFNTWTGPGYYLAIRHRNHLGAMTSTPVTSGFADFREGGAPSMGRTR